MSDLLNAKPLLLPATPPPLLVFSPTTPSKRTPQKKPKFILHVPAEHFVGRKH